MYVELIKELMDVYANDSNRCASVLDVGCGSGSNVMALKEIGYDCFGTDVEFKPGPHLEQLLQKGLVKPIDMSAVSRSTIGHVETRYSWPFEDAQFSLVASRAVLEHVRNIDDFVCENYRVLQKGGLAFHYFPSKYSFIESHVGVPFGGVVKNKYYYQMCARLGFCSKKYKANAEDALRYVSQYTEYRSVRNIVDTFEGSGFCFMGNHASLLLKYFKSGKYAFLHKSKIIAFLFELFRSNVLVFKKV